MTAHILIPALDDERPATLSPAIVDGLLKKQPRVRRPGAQRRPRDEGDQRPLRRARGDGRGDRRRLRRRADVRRLAGAAVRGARSGDSGGRGWHAAAQARRGCARAPPPGQGALPRAGAPEAAHRSGAARGARRRRASGDCRRDGEVRCSGCASRAPCGPATGSPWSRPPARSSATSSTPVSPSFERSDSSRSTRRASSRGRAMSPGRADVRAAAFRRAWDDPTVAALIAARGGYGSVQMLPLLDREAVRRHAQGVHRLQRQHVDPELAHAAVRHRVVPWPDDRRALRPGRRGLRPRHVRALPVQARGRWRDRASAPRDDCSGRGERHAPRRDADAAHGVARHAVRVRSAARIRAVPRRSGRTAVSHRPHADAAAAERPPRRARRPSSSASCRDATSPTGAPTARVDGCRRHGAAFAGRCCSACRPGHTSGATLTLPFGVRARA